MQLLPVLLLSLEWLDRFLLLLPLEANPALWKTDVHVFWMKSSAVLPLPCWVAKDSLRTATITKGKKEQQRCCKSLLPLTCRIKRGGKEQQRSLYAFIAHNELQGGEIGKRLTALLTSSSWCELKNDVEQGSWIGAKVVVRSCKPVHISNITSKLLTGQGLINAREELFLLHLPFLFFFSFFFNDEQCWEWRCWVKSSHCSVSVLPSSISFSWKSKAANSSFRNEKGGRVWKTYAALNLIYILGI